MTTHLILGGARSGKSRYAESLARQDARPVTVVATAQALDAEMAARIARHRLDRPREWRTVETPIALADCLAAEADANRQIIVDCLSLWLSNLLDGASALTDPPNASAFPRLDPERSALLECLPSLPGHIILVANEVGLGLVPDTPLGRFYRDEAGRLNQTLASICDRVTFVAAGLPLALKPGADG